MICKVRSIALMLVAFAAAGCDKKAEKPSPESPGAGVARPETSPGTAKLETSEVDLGGGVKLELVKIPAGEFEMGSPADETDRSDDEGPVQTVRIEKPFCLGKYEVTQEQWQAVQGHVRSEMKGAGNPVGTVSWNDCQEFLRKLNARVSGGGFRLPTEAEWEYACRAGTRTRFSFGDDPAYESLSQYAWYDKNSGSRPHPVGGRKPNPWGLYDMHGNVWEWSSSVHKPYPYDAQDGRETFEGEHRRVLRGGCWQDSGRICRSANRPNLSPGGRLRNCLGLRVARTIP